MNYALAGALGLLVVMLIVVAALGIQAEKSATIDPKQGRLSFT
ncbi:MULTISPECIES: hypothetical protein [Halomonas]|nr:hypothetical protein [Halomonas citrativorans]